ncbi:unnamed protein product, partial [Effrenium voratum]
MAWAALCGRRARRSRSPAPRASAGVPGTCPRKQDPAVAVTVPADEVAGLRKLLQMEPEDWRACPRHGLHGLKRCGGRSFIAECSGMVSGQTWLWADDEDAVAEFDSLAETLMEQLPQRDQLMLYTASLTIIEESVQDSKWHVDWHGIPEGLCWTFLVPVWPQ